MPQPTKILNLAHLDDNETVFFLRELTYIKTKTYDIKYANLKARTLIPVSTEVPNWADTILYQQFDEVGIAKMIVGYSDDLPRADVLGKEFSNPVKSLGAAYGYTLMEIRKSMALGKNLPQRKANAAKRAMLQKENSLAFLGDTKVNLNGFLNHPSVPLFVLPQTGTVGGNPSAMWSGSTPAQILAAMHAVANSVVNTSLGVEMPDTLLLPRSAYLYVASTPWSVNNDGRTILDLFLQQSQTITAVDWLNELEFAGTGGSRRMMAYKRDLDHVSMEIPQDFEQFDPQERNLEFVIPCHQRFGGVLFYYPLSACYADGF